MRSVRMLSLITLILVAGCSRAKTSSQVDLHFALDPAPCLFEGNRILLPQLSGTVASRKTAVTKWTVYLPDDVPVNTAIDLFSQFEKAECMNVAVYAEDANGERAKRDICLTVWPDGPVHISTEVTTNHTDALKQYTELVAQFEKAQCTVGKSGQDLLTARCQLNDLAPILRPLLAMCSEKRVRVMEAGGVEGMPGRRYSEVLEILKQLGVEKVSFYGVYVE